MSIGPFPAGLRAHRNAAAEIKKDNQGQQEKQGFLEHTVGRAQGVRAVAASLCRGASGVKLTATERRGYRSQQAAHGVDRAQIDVMRTSAQQLLGPEINRIVA